MAGRSPHPHRRAHPTLKPEAGGLRPTILTVVAAVAAAALLAPIAPALAGAHHHHKGHHARAATAGPSPLWGLGVTNSAVDPQTLQDAMGTTFAAQGIYTPLSGERYPTSYSERAENNGARVYLNINSWHVVGNQKVCYPYRNYPTGAYDSMLQTWVNELQAFNYPDTFLTFTHEPTASNVHQPGCGTSSEYVSAFDYVYHYFRNHGITYPFVWWMVASSFRMHDAVSWQPPTSDFSFVAVDGYNRDTGGNWRSPEYIFTAAHDYAESLGKPLLVGEIGTVESPGNPGWKPAWITDAASLLRTWGVEAILWCDANPFRPDTTSASLDAWVAAARANGGGGGGGGTTFLANAAGVPGGTGTTWFSGFAPGEHVSIRLNTRSGPVLGTGAADSSGAAHGVALRFPTTVHGGVHALVAVGVTSGLTAQATVTISPTQPPSFTIAAGEKWLMHALGFQPGEQVTVTFPGGAPVSATADQDGAVAITAVSPPEPAGGGYVQVSSSSDSFQVRFHTRATVRVRRLTSPQQSVHVALTGFGAGETVDVSVRGGPSLGTLSADPGGSASGTIALPEAFGPHVILFTGETSGVRRQHWVGIRPTLSLSAASGAKGSTVTVTSGPGWDPGETLDVYVAGVQVGVATADGRGVVTATVVIDRKRRGRLRIKLKDPVSGLRARAWFVET